MRRLIFIIVPISILSVFLISAAWCQDIKGRWGLGYRYGFVDSDDADYKTNGNSHNLNLTYGLTDNLALECESGYYKLQSKAGTDLGVYSFHAGLQLRKEIKNLVPYLTGGLGFQHYGYSELGDGDRKDNNYSYSYRTGAGAEYFFTDNFALNAEVVYIYGNTGGNATLDAYGWQYGGGIKYYF